MKITSWSLSSSSQWEPSPSSWLWWGPSCALGAPRPTRKSKKLSHIFTFLLFVSNFSMLLSKIHPLTLFLPKLSSFLCPFFLVRWPLCHLLSINEISLSPLPLCPLPQKTGCLKVLKRLPQIQGKLQRPEAT